MIVAKAKSKYVRVSPYKLRRYADAIRKWPVEKALRWLRTSSVKAARHVEKAVFSAYSNAKKMNESSENSVDTKVAMIQEIRIDQGPIIKYFKPGAMGRANVQRKRLSHIEVKVLCQD